MKKNLFFLGLLSLLLIFTYFYQEKKDRAFYDGKESFENTLQEGLNFEKLKSIKLKKTVIEKKGDNYFLPRFNYPASKEIIEDLFRRLTQIKIKRIFKEDEIKELKEEDYLEKDASTMTFIFEENKEISFTVGKKIEFNDNFYLKVKRDDKESLFIAYLEKPNETFLGNEEEYERYQYEELVTLIRKDDPYFLRREIIDSKILLDDILSIQIENNHNRPFLVDFKNNITNPASFDGVSYDKDFIKIFLKEITTVLADDLIFNGDEKKLANLGSKALIKLNNGKEIILNIYYKYDGRDGYFITVSNMGSTIFEFNKAMTKIFFLNVQDFWSKAVLTENNLFDKGDVTFKMDFSKNKEFELKVPYEKEFRVEILNTFDQNKFFQPNLNSFKSLFLILMGTYKEKARHISPLSDNDIKIHEGKENIKLILPDTTLMLVKLGDELIIDNNKYAYKIHYLFHDIVPFDLDIESFFYQQVIKEK